ncbi:MAG: hypothetical protein M8353_11455, partial [ANME-2 cluster archaeon]|nr:hypothetical protein [ANME-2 cluster archaeon]
GCFDNINHEWLLDNIPMDKSILKQFLKSGFVYNRHLNPTKAGTPQGGTPPPTTEYNYPSLPPNKKHPMPDRKMEKHLPAPHTTREGRSRPGRAPYISEPEGAVAEP